MSRSKSHFYKASLSPSSPHNLYPRPHGGARPAARHAGLLAVSRLGPQPRRRPRPRLRRRPRPARARERPQVLLVKLRHILLDLPQSVTRRLKVI